MKSHLLTLLRRRKSGWSLATPSSIRALWTIGPTPLCYQDSGRTVPFTADGDLIGSVSDPVNGFHVSIPDASRPTGRLINGVWWAVGDGSSAQMPIPVGAVSGLAAGEIICAKYNNAAAQTAGWDFGTGVGNWWPFADSNVYEDFGSNTRRTVGNFGLFAAPQAYGCSSAAGAWAAYLNNGVTPIFTDTVNTVAWSATPNLMHGTAGFDAIHLAVAALYGAVLSAADRAKAYPYVKTKWGTA